MLSLVLPVLSGVLFIHCTAIFMILVSKSVKKHTACLLLCFIHQVPTMSHNLLAYIYSFILTNGNSLVTQMLFHCTKQPLSVYWHTEKTSKWDALVFQQMNTLVDIFSSPSVFLISHLVPGVGTAEQPDARQAAKAGGHQQRFPATCPPPAPPPPSF